MVSPPTRGWTHAARTSDLAAGAVSPPTRGWTISEIRPWHRPIGFPAHAGMDRGSGQRLRRSRLVSPPTRGWTVLQYHELPHSLGFPAHAGMDPSQLGIRSRLVRGFPAHAGMDPTSWTTTWLPRGFPRPRGDGPVYVRDIAEGKRGFPAHAGMDPFCKSVKPNALTSTRVSPPTRGWTIQELPVIAARWVSPPTRGWTRTGLRRRLGRGTSVSPPTRGWTQANVTWGVVSCGFPRPRGDGPSPKRGAPALVGAGGFPAHAGMDPAGIVGA